MANMLGGGGGDAGGGGMGGGIGMNQFPLEQWFYETPICTRIWTSATVITSLLVQCAVLNPFQLFYSLRAVFSKNQYWRLATTFFYFGPMSLDLLLHVFFMQRYSRLLEESYGGSPAQYSWLLAFAATSLLCLSPLFSIPFLGQALSSTLVYIWSRRNPETRLSFLGLLVFRAPFLPWVLLIFSFVVYGHLPKDEVCGIAIGHVYYFFSDVFPPVHNGYRPLDPPSWWLRLFESTPNPGQATTPTDEVRLDRGDIAAAAPEVPGAG